MAARAIASTSISFGLVTLPVKIYSAGEPSARVSFNMIHEACGSRLRQQYVCTKCDDVVEREEIVKGYEFAKGQYVLFTPEELAAIETPKTEGIEIIEFVPLDEVDPVFFDRAYYLGPDKAGARAYRLLARALEETGRAAIAKYATRGKAYVVMVLPRDGLLLMEQLHYADEVRPASEVPIEDGDVKKQELDLAKQLVEAGSSETFDASKYHDEVREQMLEMIQRKVEGEEITAAPAAARAEPQIIDIMAALKASIKDFESKDRKPAARATKKAAAKKTAKKKAASR
ncbi:MAG: Ku protein [Gemmatimonadota bacterium]